MKLIAPIIIAALFFLFQGCIEIKTVINVNDDGSGTLEETVIMSKMLVEMIASFTSSFADSSAPAEEFSLYNEEELKSNAAKMGSNVQFVSGKELKTDQGDGYLATYKFSDINGLTIDQDPGSKISLPGTTDAEPEKEVMSFNFVKGDQSTLTIDLPQDMNKDEDEHEDENEDSTSVEETHDTTGMAQMLPLMESLRIAVIVNVDGQIVETNASNVKGSEITLLDMKFGELLKDPAKLEELKKINPASFDEVKELLKTVPGLTIEFNDPVKVVFK